MYLHEKDIIYIFLSIKLYYVTITATDLSTSMFEIRHLLNVHQRRPVSVKQPDCFPTKVFLVCLTHCSSVFIKYLNLF